MYESYVLNYDELKSMTETDIEWPEDVKRNVRHAIEDLGINEVINAIGLAKVIEAVGIEKVELELKRIKSEKSQKNKK